MSSYGIVFSKMHEQEFAEILARMLTACNPGIDEMEAVDIIMTRLEKVEHIDIREATLIGEFVGFTVPDLGPVVFN